MATVDQTRASAPPPGWGDPVLVTAQGTGRRRVLPLIAWVACLAVALGLLLALGDGRLAAPSLTQPGTWSAWAAGRDPIEVVVVALRVFALGLAWYLVGVTSISVLARVLRAARLIRIADALSFGPVRVLAQQAVGVGLAAGVLASAVPGVAVTSHTTSAPGATGVEVAVPMPSGGDVETAVPLADGGRVEPAMFGDASEPLVPDAPVVAAGTGDVEVMAPIPGPQVATAPDVADVVEVVPAVPAPEVAPTPGTDANPQVLGGTDLREVRVAPGDHLWSLAEDDVARHLGRVGTEQEVAAHWEDVVAANADRLQVPGNPDLLLPGQLVVLPPVAGGGA